MNAPQNAIAVSKGQSILYMAIAYILYVGVTIVSTMTGYYIFAHSRGHPQSTLEYSVVVTAIGSGALGLLPLAVGICSIVMRGSNFSLSLKRFLMDHRRYRRWLPIFLLPCMTAADNCIVFWFDGDERESLNSKGYTIAYGLVGGLVVAGIIYSIGLLLDLVAWWTRPVLPPQPPGGAIGMPILIPVGPRGGRPGGAERIALARRL